MEERCTLIISYFISKFYLKRLQTSTIVQKRYRIFSKETDFLVEEYNFICTVRGYGISGCLVAMYAISEVRYIKMPTKQISLMNSRP